MKFILKMSGTKANFDWYSNWSKEDLQANTAHMRAFGEQLKDSGVLVSAEGLDFPGAAKIVRAGPNTAPSPGGERSGIPIEVRRVLPGAPLA